MSALGFFQTLPVVLAILTTVSSSPLSSRDVFPRDDQIWPSTVAGEVYNSSWSGYAQATERWSSYEAPTFDQVFLPASEHDLSVGLQYLSSHNLTWLVKSGGHGYPTTLHAIQNAVMINMANFNYTRVENNGTIVNGSLIVGAGSNFGAMIDAAGAANRELTVGSCACVGAGGAALGGGLGRLQGLHGLTSDAIRSVRLALWNGSIIEASSTVNSDLFWGLRGSGQNYGVVTEFTFETWPVTNGGLVYNADLTFTKDSVGRIADTINNLTAAGLDSRVALLTYFAQDAATSQLAVILDIVYMGSEAEGQAYTKLFSSYSSTLVESVYSWTELPTRSVLGLIPASCVDGPRYNLYSSITKVISPQTFTDFAYAFEQFMLDNPKANGSALQIETFAQQGIAALPDDYSAFPHRHHFQSQVESIGVYEDDSVATAVNQFLEGWRNNFSSPAVSGYDKVYIYQNYGHGDEPLSTFYGYSEWRHERLTNLKNRYDPHSFFNGYHPIPHNIKDWS